MFLLILVLGKLPVPGRPTILITVGQGPIALAVGAGGGGLDIFTLIYPFSFLSPSLWETARYRLKYCLKGPLSPKQPTNQILLILYQISNKPYNLLVEYTQGLNPITGWYCGCRSGAPTVFCTCGFSALVFRILPLRSRKQCSQTEQGEHLLCKRRCC